MLLLLCGFLRFRSRAVLMTQIVERCVLLIVNEAYRVLGEDIVQRPADNDTIMFEIIYCLIYSIYTVSDIIIL
jgi:hypothetical protein